jgi:hypothetical protein
MPAARSLSGGGGTVSNPYALLSAESPTVGGGGGDEGSSGGRSSSRGSTPHTPHTPLSHRRGSPGPSPPPRTLFSDEELGGPLPGHGGPGGCDVQTLSAPGGARARGGRSKSDDDALRVSGEQAPAPTGFAPARSSLTPSPPNVKSRVGSGSGAASAASAAVTAPAASASGAALAAAACRSPPPASPAPRARSPVRGSGGAPASSGPPLLPSSWWPYLSSELGLTAPPRRPAPDRYKRERVYNTLWGVPRRLEEMQAYSALVCVDALLALVTTLPLRAAVATWRLARRPRGGSGVGALGGAQARHVTEQLLCDVLWCAIFAATTAVLYCQGARVPAPEWCHACVACCRVHTAPACTYSASDRIQMGCCAQTCPSFTTSSAARRL